MKKTICMILTLFVMMSNTRVFADNNIEEELNASEIDELVKTTVAEGEEIPIINSRHAVIYDRSTRQSLIWKTRK